LMDRKRRGKITAYEHKATRVVKLRDLEPGMCGTIQRLSCRGHLRRRLMDMGVVAGTRFEVERVAPLGDPVELRIKGFHLTLRKQEAGDIWVEVEEIDGS
jgi:Fe2+ transport system protein FeoA